MAASYCGRVTLSCHLILSQAYPQEALGEVARRLLSATETFLKIECLQVMFVRRNGSIVLAGVEESPPAYARMRELLQGVKGSRTSQTWVNRVFPSQRFGKPCAIVVPP